MSNSRNKEIMVCKKALFNAKKAARVTEEVKSALIAGTTAILDKFNEKKLQEENIAKYGMAFKPIKVGGKIY